MSLVLVDLKSNQFIQLNNNNPLIIGRKNLSECNDKRVSRNHGKITCTQNGKIILSALHSNPCFFTINGKPPVLQLNKNEEQILSEGDCLGLLPDAFWFQIKAKINSEETTSEKLKSNKLSDKPNKMNCTDVLNIDTNLDSEVLIKDIKREVQDNDNLNLSSATTSNPKSSEPHSSWKYGDKDFEQTRRLPLWMYQIDPPPNQTDQESKDHLKNIKCTEEPEEKRAKIEIDISSSSKELTPATNQTNSEPKICKNVMEKDGYESDVKIEPMPGTSQRPVCQYDENCYRKNPQHKIDFCHPGDADYVSYENRPMCEYGASCYRKSKAHKVQYRHPDLLSNNDDIHYSSQSSCSCRYSSDEERPPCLSGTLSPSSKKRKRKTVARQGVPSEDFGDGGSDYSLEDPFVNDASSDEYLPSDDTGKELDAFDSDDN